MSFNLQEENGKDPNKKYGRLILNRFNLQEENGKKNIPPSSSPAMGVSISKRRMESGIFLVYRGHVGVFQSPRGEWKVQTLNANVGAMIVSISKRRMESP